MVDSHSSVGIVVHHTELNALVIVRQFRPAVSHTQKHFSQDGLPQQSPLSHCPGAAASAQICMQHVGLKVAHESWRIMWVP